ncbi:AAA family ATPase, partial [Moraxella catarrhalis]|uniref:AAA family ATPase n=1 Tax=Moraxella catarrhalis TaxID=480 RepID=UPI000EA9CD27
MSIVLNNEQELAKNELLEFILTPSKLKQDSIIVLSGAAGTGKTTLLKSVIDNYKAIKELNKIINMPTTQRRWEFTAMTHKAARVLSQVIKLPVNTLHHELRIRPLK